MSAPYSSLEQPRLLAQTERWWVVAKPPGWLSVRPTAPGIDARPVVLDWVRERGEAFPVHRLDVETSGVIVFARDRDGHREANLWFESRKVSKTYHALAAGAPTAPMIRVNEPVAGKPATSQIEVKERFPGVANDAFLASVTPRTGRRHQIRIHLAAEGLPIFGDLEYGGHREVVLASGGRLEIARVALHASRLVLPSGETFEAPWPADFSAWVEAMRGARG